MNEFQSPHPEFRNTAAFLLYNIFKLDFLINGKNSKEFEYVSTTEISLINSEGGDYDAKVKYGFRTMENLLEKGYDE